jgi:predicted transcriptional regulator with HTH domain
MIEQLFGSKTRVKLLQLFYSNPNRSFYVREITRKIDEQINSVRRELANLLSVGIISSENNNNRLYYEVNQEFEYHQPLTEIFGAGVSPKAKAGAPKTEEAEDLSELGNVKLAFYSGQFTRDETAGVDLVIVGDVNATKFEKFVAELEKKEGKEIRYAVMQMGELEYRRQVNDRFVGLLETAKKQIVIDKEFIFTKKPEKEQVEPLKKEKKAKKAKSKE